MHTNKLFRIPSRFLSNITSYPSFKSLQSIERLYPKKNVSIDSSIPLEKTFDINNKFTGFIPIRKLDISYCTSSGPGGQNVNRVQTKVMVKFHVQNADWIPDDIKTRIQELNKNSINKEGYWIIKSEKTREQSLNLADCMDKLRCFIAEATQPINIEPSFETLEILKRRREKAAQKRLENKKHRSMYKAEKRLD